MMYFDSSAIVKRYLEEAGSDTVNKMVNEASVIATSQLTYPEIVSAFAKKQRGRDISRDNYVKALNEFEREWDYFFIIKFHDEFFSTIRKLIERHALRAADSIHLASALWLKQSVKENVTFVASDGILLSAARAEKLSAVNPQDH